MVSGNDTALNILLNSKDNTGPALESAEGRFDKFHKKLMDGKLAWAGIGGAAATAMGFLSDAARAGAEDEASQSRMQKAIENTGKKYKDVQKTIEDRIKAGQALAFSDDQVRDSLSILTAQTGDVNEAMTRQKLAFDLSRGAHIDVATASKLLGKVTDENVNVLGRYGIHVEKGADQTKLFGAIQEKFGGQAETYGKSTAGSIEKVKNATDDWKESLGQALGPMQPFVALLPGMSASLSLIGTVAVPMASGLLGIAKAQRTAAIASTLLNIAMGPVGIIVLAIAGAVALLALAWANNWGDIQGKTKAVIGVVGPILSGFFGALQALWEKAGPIIQAAAKIILAPIFTIVDTVSHAIGLLERLGIIKKQQAPLASPNVHGIIGAAGGFNDVVTRPTLFLAGEGGDEYVNIRPVGRSAGASAGGSTIFQITIEGNVDSEDRVHQLGVEFERRRRLYGGRTVAA